MWMGISLSIISSIYEVRFTKYEVE